MSLMYCYLSEGWEMGELRNMEVSSNLIYLYANGVTQELLLGDHFSGQRWAGWGSPPRSVKFVYVVPTLCLNINTLHFRRQIWLGKFLKYLKSGLLKLLPRSAVRQKLCAVRGRNCISVLMPVNAVCCCHLLPPGCHRWCPSAWWHGSFVGISADGYWQEWAMGKIKRRKLLFCIWRFLFWSIEDLTIQLFISFWLTIF